MKIYVTSDTHFGHKKLIEWGRDPNFEELELRSHEKIGADDYLIHLGDFCIGKDAEHHEVFMKRLAHVKHKVLVRGNHDHKSNGWYLEHGWSAVVDQMVMNLFGKTVVFSHIPVRPAKWFAMDYNVHGHTHGDHHRDFEVRGIYDLDFHREVAMELTKYRPILMTKTFLEDGRFST